MITNDEKIKEGLALLFNHYWILRKTDPESYHLLRSIEKELIVLIKERFGYNIRITTEYVKLEKIPVEARSWMGIQEFQSSLDYTLFCCLLAFLEDKGSGNYFLLSHICEELTRLYPEADTLDWTNFTQRKALVRVIKKASELHLIESIDGDLEQFGQHEEAEVLYVSTEYSRQFMRPYPQEIYGYSHWSELKADEDQQFDTENETRFRAYRQLFLEPSILRAEADERVFLYLRKQRQSIAEFVEIYTDFHYELYKNFAQITASSSTTPHTFPTTKSLDDILLQLGTFIRQKDYPVGEHGEIRLSEIEWFECLKELKYEYGFGWSKEYRETKSLEALQEELLQRGEQYVLIRKAASEIWILPELARFSGKYSQDFLTKKKEEVEKWLKDGI